MIAHLCCSVDAGYFLKRLKDDYPDEKITGYFYDPNIHPYSEFKLRSLDTKRICEKLDVEYVEGEYNYEEWLRAVRGKENEPEKGARCSVCFDFSLEEAARFAKEIGDNKVTTSLLMSPMKSHEQLEKIGKVIKRKYDVEFFVPDYRKKGGTQAQQEFAKEHQLYRQDYCGCLYGIWQQKKNQDIIDELVSPFPFQTLPASIEEKIKFYDNRLNLEEKGVKYKIVKENFLNYRLLKSRITYKKTPVFHYTLFYSYLSRPQRIRIETQQNGIGYTNRAQVIFVKLSKINTLLNKTYQDIEGIYQNPLSIEEEISLREKITNTKYNLSPIIVLENFEDIRYDIEIEAKIYPDTKENLIKF